MYDLKIEDPNMNDAVWVERAKRGNAHELAKLAEFMPKFICEHTADGAILQKLEDFEASQRQVRKFTGPFFKAFGEIPSHVVGGIWRTSIFQAALTAPKCYNASGLFNHLEICTKKDVR